jgi:hypothetical protein
VGALIPAVLTLNIEWKYGKRHRKHVDRHMWVETKQTGAMSDCKAARAPRTWPEKIEKSSETFV